MLDLLMQDPLTFIVVILGLILSITIHEFSHAWTADKLGDPTPRLQGRVTLNPLAHLDPIGTIAMVLIRFGWGKPVQYDPFNLRKPLRDAMLIALAGPAANILLAVTIAGVLRLPFQLPDLAQSILVQVFLLNIVLAIFNFVPVAPLDGSKIILPFLPKNLAIEYESFMHRYGILLLFALLVPWANGQSPISALISPIIRLITAVLLP